MARILVIQLERLGDLIQTTPLLQALHAAHPGAEVELLLTAGTETVVDGLAGIARIHTVPEASVAAASRLLGDGMAQARVPMEAEALRDALDLPDYDRVINLSHHQFGCWLADQLHGREREGGVVDAQGRWTYRGDWHVYLVAMLDFRERNRFNLVDVYRAAAGPLPVPAEGTHAYLPRVAPPATLPPAPRVALNPGASRDYRRWPETRFAALADALAAAGIAPVLVGAPADAPVCERIAAACARPPVNLAGRTTVAEMAGLLADMDLLVSNDTGAVHMAAAVGTPVVGLYGATWYSELGPWGEGHVILQVPLDTERPDWGPLTPALVGAVVLGRLGRTAPAKVRQQLDAAGVQAWETFFLPAGADPLGGLGYRPLHSATLAPAELFAWLLRGVFAWEFARRRGPLAAARWRHVLADLLPSPGDDGGIDAAVDACCGQLESLAELAGAAMRLARHNDGEHRGRLEQVTAELSAGLDGLDSLAEDNQALQPVLAFLSWKLRMLPQSHAMALFMDHANELNRAAAMLRSGLDLYRKVRAPA